MEQMRLRRWEGCALVAILLFCAALRFWPLGYDTYHPDEDISVGVAHQVVESGSLDTNWKNAALPPDFKLPQYNFSGYLLSAAAVDALLKVMPGDEPRGTLAALRLWSAILAVAAAALTFLVGRRFFGAPAALVATLLVTINPLLAQDGFYARPEPFVTVLTLLLVLGGTGPLVVRRIFGAALIAGILIATKISMLALLPLLFVPETQDSPLGAYLRRAFQEFPKRAAAAVPGVVLGFIAAAPFALVNREDYFEGIAFLMRQYAAPQWPYGLGEASVSERLIYVARYFGATTGAPALILCLLGAVWAASLKNFRALAVFLCFGVFAVWFATMPTFFERNFSHLMPMVLIFAAHGLVQTAGLVRAPAFRPVALTAFLLLAIFPAARTTYFLLAEEITGQSWRDIAQLRAQLVRDTGAELTILGADQDYTNLRDENFRICGRWLLEIPHYHGARSDAALVNVSAATGFTEVGRFTSHFAYVPTSSLHTYVMPTRVYLFRGDEAPCDDSPDVVDPRTVGPEFDLIALEPEPAWTKGGAYPTAVGFVPENYFGTWSWVVENNAGTLRLSARVEGQTEMVLPTLTGADTRNQSIRVSDRETGAEIVNMSPLPASARWAYRRIRLPAQTREILVEAVDNGIAPAEWQALAPPRAVRK